jgi:hypothetical protein
MAIARVGAGSGKKVFDAAGTTIQLTGITATTSGNILIVMGSLIYTGTVGTVTAVTDSSGSGTWVIRQTAASADKVLAFICYKENCGAGITTVTVTVNGDAGSNYAIASAEEYSGVATSSSQDQINSAVGSSEPTPLSTGSITNADANDLLIACCGSDDSVNGTWTVGGSTPWTDSHDEGDTSAHHASKGVFRIVAGSTGPFNATFSYNVETVEAAAIIVSFKEGGGGGGGFQSAWARNSNTVIQPGR